MSLMEVLKGEDPDFTEHEQEQTGLAPEPDPVEREGEGGDGEENEGDDPVEAKGTDNGESKPDEKDTVPLATHLEEKNARRAMQRELEELRRTQQELVSRLETQAKPPEEENTPDPEEDPIGYLRYQNEQLAKKIETLTSGQETEKQAQQSQASLQRLGAMEEQFAKENPDYFDAMEFLRDARVADYMASGDTEEEAKDNWAKESLFFVQRAAKNGNNPIEVAYTMAKRHGYQPKGNTGEGGEGKAGTTEDKARLDRLSKAQQTAQTLSRSGGRGKNDSISLEDAANLPDSQFDKLFVGDGGDENFRKLFSS